MTRAQPILMALAWALVTYAVPVGAQHLHIASKSTGDSVVRMGGAESLRRRANGRYLYVQLPLDLETWSYGRNPVWLPSLLHEEQRKDSSPPASYGAMLRMHNNNTKAKKTAITLRGNRTDVGVTIMKPLGLREIHVDAEGIVLDGVNLTEACVDFTSTGRVSHEAVRLATVHAPLACVSDHQEEDSVLSISKAGLWGHIVLDDLDGPEGLGTTVLLSRPDDECIMRANAPIFLGGKNMTGCMVAVFKTMHTPELVMLPSPPPPSREVDATATTTSNASVGTAFVATANTTATTTVRMMFVVEDWSLDLVDTMQNTSRRQLLAHAVLDTQTLASIKKEVVGAVASVGLVLPEEDVTLVASTLTDHSSSIDVTIRVTEEVHLELQKAVNATMYSATFYVALEAIVLGDVYAVTVTFNVVVVVVSTAMAAPASSAFPPGAVWWNGETGDWQDPSIWIGGDVNNASEVFICPPNLSNGTVFVRDGYTRANGLTLCNSSSDTDTLVIEGDLCIGERCP